MDFIEAIRVAGAKPPDSEKRHPKKLYSEKLSHGLAYALAAKLRDAGFHGTRPEAGGPKEAQFQGGLSSKRVDVSYSDEMHGLMLGVSVKGINFPSFGKNLPNRFADLCTEAVNLHMRFPFAVLGVLFVMPEDADLDLTERRTVSTFRRAARMMATISGREDYSDTPESFENATMLRYRPESHPEGPHVDLFSADDVGAALTEAEYVERLRAAYNVRNPLRPVGE
jgi:hypothetical protein